MALPIRPAEHTLQATSPVRLNWPLGQSLHAVDSVTLALNCPAVHVAHCVADVFAANFPPSHCAHSAALAPLYCPGSQETHTVKPVASANLPASQALQYVDPAVSWICPALHALQCCALLVGRPVFPCLPWLHCAQDDLPVVFWKLPAEQSVHILLEVVGANFPAGQGAHAPPFCCG